MTWHEFPLFFYISSALWLTGVIIQIGLLISKTRRKSKQNSFLDIVSQTAIIGGTLTIILFTVFLWIELGRPVFRTLGETRLWYSIFLATIGVALYYRWRLREILLYCIPMANLFLLINLLNPDYFDKTLMPALQSPWFVPHVVVYIIGYAFLAFSALIGIIGLIRIFKKTDFNETLKIADNAVYVGFALITFGMLFGAMWAKEAWGHYWSWDPKETWALIAWMGYLIYIHIRINHKTNAKLAFWILALIFIFLLISWFGINSLPSASDSVHVY